MVEREIDQTVIDLKMFKVNKSQVGLLVSNDDFAINEIAPSRYLT